MLTYSKSTMRLRCMLMHLISGQVTLMQGKFFPLNFSPVGLIAPSGFTLGFAPNF